MSIILYPIRRLNSDGFHKLKNPIPGDKSISHRALLFGALAQGKTEVSNLLNSGDVLSTWSCLEKLGTRITRLRGDRIVVEGRGFFASQLPLDCGNSGTTIRLLSGILAGQTFASQLIGDPSLSRRPMKRLTEPLRKMGAEISLRESQFAPIQIQGRPLQGITYDLPVASAQLKSALLLAGLFAEGTTCLRGKIQSRDHTERLLPQFGVKLSFAIDTVSIEGFQKLRGTEIQVPNDPSSAAFWIAAVLIVPKSELVLENISLNPTRIGFLTILKRMGANIETEITRSSPEPMGRIRVRSSQLEGTLVASEEVPFVVDELPLLAVLATFAHGITSVSGAEELRIKETDRIAAVAENLQKMGADVKTFPDGFSISGPQPLTGAKIDSYDDHRIAMAFSIAALQVKGPTEILSPECVSISYPQFFEVLERICN